MNLVLVLTTADLRANASPPQLEVAASITDIAVAQSTDEPRVQWRVVIEIHLLNTGSEPIWVALGELQLRVTKRGGFLIFTVPKRLGGSNDIRPDNFQSRVELREGEWGHVGVGEFDFRSENEALKCVSEFVFVYSVSSEYGERFNVWSGELKEPAELKIPTG